MSEIKRIANSLLETNTYVYVSDDSRCLLVDPGSDYEVINNFLKSKGLKPEVILATHGHFDHVASAARLQEEYGCKFYLHKKDLKTLKLSNFMMKMFGLKGSIKIPSPDHVFEDSQEFALLDKEVNFYNTPGHTAGSCVIKIDNVLFTGDTLFYSRVSSKIPNDSAKLLAESQKWIFDTFSGELMVLPGHGESGSLKDVRSRMQQTIN